jgi:hypothetical protein
VVSSRAQAPAETIPTPTTPVITFLTMLICSP